MAGINISERMGGIVQHAVKDRDEHPVFESRLMMGLANAMASEDRRTRLR